MIDQIKEGKVKDFVRDVTDTYDYLKGSRRSRYRYDEELYIEDLVGTLLDDGNLEDLQDSEFYYDRRHRMLRMRLDARRTPVEFARRIDPSLRHDKDSLWKYVTSYDDHVVTLEIPMDINVDTSLTEESVMVPTPTPYRGYQVDRDGRLITDRRSRSRYGDNSSTNTRSDSTYDNTSLETDIRNESTETLPESPREDGMEYGGYIISLDSRLKNYFVYDLEGRHVSCIPEDKGIDFVKKSIDSSTLELDESVRSLVQPRLSINIDSNSYTYRSDRLVDSIDLTSLNEMKESMRSTKVEKFSFKDNHICSGCDLPISECTCDVNESDIISEEATQSSSIGQYKTTSTSSVTSDEEIDSGVEEDVNKDSPDESALLVPSISGE